MAERIPLHDAGMVSSHNDRFKPYFFVASRAGQPLDFIAPIPTSIDFHRRLWSGEITLSGQASG